MTVTFKPYPLTARELLKELLKECDLDSRVVILSAPDVRWEVLSVYATDKKEICIDIKRVPKSLPTPDFPLRKLRGKRG